jgi:DNA repair and recombination protein RAD52
MRPPQPPQDSGPARQNPAQPVVAGRVLNQPSRMASGPPSNPASPSKINKYHEDDDKDPGMPPPGAGFFSARAASMVPEGPITEPLPLSHVQNLPVFNPKAESPSIRKTPGIDYKGSRPITKDLKQLPNASQAPAAPGARPNIVNPQLDATRRIGAPGSPSPMANRGQYKPPTMKRPIDGMGGGGLARVPLVDLPANGAIGAAIGDAGGDAKRQRLNN